MAQHQLRLRNKVVGNEGGKRAEAPELEVSASIVVETPGSRALLNMGSGRAEWLCLPSSCGGQHLMTIILTSATKALGISTVGV